MTSPPSVVLAMASEDDGGLARVASMLATGLADVGFEIAVAMQRDGRISAELRHAGLPVHILPELIETLDRSADGRSSLGATARNLVTLGRGVGALRAIAMRHGASLFYSHGSWPNHLVAEATRGWRGAAPVAVWHVHTASGRANMRVARLMARRGDLRSIIGVSRSVLEPYAGFDAPKDVVYNGVDLRACARASKAPVLRRRLGLARDAFVFGYAGRLVPHKGIPVLAAAAAQILLQLPEAHFVLLGGNPASGGGDMLAQLRQGLQSAGVADRAHLPGYQPDALAWIADFDVSLVPSTYPDPCPLAVLEALALGVPVLGSRIGGIPEQIEDGVDGLLLAPGDVQALVEAVVDLAGRPERQALMSARALQNAKARFGAEAMVQGVAAVLEAAARPREHA